MTDAAAQRLKNARSLGQLRDLMTGRVKQWAAPAVDPGGFALELDREASLAYAQRTIPTHTGALKEALTTPGHPNKRVSWSGSQGAVLSWRVTVWHPLPIYRPGLMPPFPIEAVQAALERSRRG